MDEKTKYLLLDAKAEIEVLHRRNEILEAQMAVVDIFGSIMRLSGSRVSGYVGGKISVSHQIGWFVEAAEKPAQPAAQHHNAGEAPQNVEESSE